MQNALVKDGLISRLRKYGCLCRPGRGIGKPFFLCCLGTGQPPKHLLAASPKIRPLCPSAQMGCKELPTQMAHRPIPLGLHIPTHQGTTRWRGETESTPFTQPTSLPPKTMFILMQHCHHSLSISPLIQGIPMVLAGGMGYRSPAEWDTLQVPP